MKLTKEQVEEAYKIIQSRRGKKSTLVGMSMSERGKRGAEARKRKRLEKNA